MINYIKSLFAWKLVRDEGSSFYYENTITGKRKAWKFRNANYHLGSTNWLKGGEWTYIRPLPPYFNKIEKDKNE